MRGKETIKNLLWHLYAAQSIWNPNAVESQFESGQVSALAFGDRDEPGRDLPGVFPRQFRRGRLRVAALDQL